MLLDICESRLSVHISCNNLRNLDIIGRSDPFAILWLDATGVPSTSGPSFSSSRLPPPPPERVTLRSLRRSRYTPRDDRWQRIGTTETVPNSLNATFATSFEIQYFFERAQKLAIDLFDRDVASQKLHDIHKHDYLGSAEIPVPALVRAPGQKMILPLSLPDDPDRNCGTVTLVVEEVSQGKQRLAYDLAISNLPVQRGRGPFVTVSRPSAAATQDEPWIKVMRLGGGNVVVKGKVITMPKLTYNYEKFCRCDDEMPLRFDVSFEKAAKHKVVASAVSTLCAIDRNNGRLQLSHTKSNSCFFTPSPPLLQFSNRAISEDITFLDYIIGGCEISLVIAIDFTASNGDPSQRGTLHFMDSMEANEYELAIRSAGDILAAYDSDQLFPAYGFGAKLPPEFRQPSHCFPLNNSPDASCHTIDEVLNMYRHTLYNVRLSGPTVFSEVVRAAAGHAHMEMQETEQSYTILLIITDGVINDLENTLNEITKASSLPLSIVIVGVGDADFTDMDCLDGDDMDLERDIVQFVNFRHYKDTPEVLRSKILEEIPGQVVQYMKQRRIMPRPPPVD